MKKLAVIILLVATAGGLALATSASAHPLGNFTINRYSRIEPSGNRLYVLYVLDLAEIPTFQARPRVAAEGEGRYATRLARTIGRHLELTVDGRRSVLTPIRRVLAFPPGQAGLRTTRLEVVFRGPELGHTSRVSYRDANYAGRIGWKEITAQPQAGARLLSSSVPSKSASSELLAYPKNLLQSPLDVVSARVDLEPGSSAGAPPGLLPRNVLEQRAGVRAVADGGFASLIARDHLTPGFIALSLLIAMFWGAAHALSPGHGKSIVAAYLVGSRGKPRHAVYPRADRDRNAHDRRLRARPRHAQPVRFHRPRPALPVAQPRLGAPDRQRRLSVLRWRVREWRGRGGHEHDHGHSHGHGHPDHEHDHALSHRRLLGIGISGGIIPCPTALVVLLAAISLHRVGYGLVLILAFSVGLAVAMTAIGLVAVTAKRAFTASISTAARSDSSPRSARSSCSASAWR